MNFGLGVAAGPDPSVLRDVAPEAERLGYVAAFANDHPGGEGLVQLAEWAAATSTIKLGVGVMALDRHEPAAVAARVTELGLPHDRLLLGIGAGFNAKPVTAVRDGVAELRRLLPDVQILVAAMGPRMCALAGEAGNGALLNWMAPGRARWARELVTEGARTAGRDPSSVPIYGYVRTAIGDDAAERLAAEAGFYFQLPHYRRHFDAQDVEPATVGVASPTAEAAAASLAEYDGLDVAVVRVLSGRTAAEVLEVAREAIGA